MLNTSISLIITTYNRSSLLKRAIDSVYNCEFDEIIVVNDGSTEEETIKIDQILNNYPRIKSIKHDKNYGLAYARNTGIRTSESVWVTFLDDDDYYIDNPVKDLKEFIIKNSKADIIHYKIRNKNVGGHIIDWGYESFTLKELVENNRLSGSSLLKKQVWETLNGYKNIPYEDWEFWIRAKECGFTFVYYPKIFYYRETSFDGLELKTDQKISALEWKKTYCSHLNFNVKKNKDIAIGISTFLRDDSLFKLIDSILKYLPEFKMYIADGGRESEKKNLIYNNLKKQGHCPEYIAFDSGISKTRKILKERCKEQFLVYMEDDFEATPKTNLYKLKEILDENSDLGVVGGNLERYPVTGAYSYFLERLEDKIIYFPLDYLLNKKLVYWNTTSKGSKFLRADIVSDFTMWRKEVPNIFDENVKTIEHTDVYLLVKTKTKYKVAFCPETEIRHAHNTNESQEYNQFRGRREELEYLKKYWKVSDFYQLKSHQLRAIENQSICESKLETCEKIENIAPVEVNSLKSDHENCIKIITELQKNKITFFLIKNSCLDAIFKRNLKLPLQIEVRNIDIKQTLEKSIDKKNLEIEIDSASKLLKTCDINNIKVNVPCPVVAYLEKTFNKSWKELQQ